MQVLIKTFKQSLIGLDRRYQENNDNNIAFDDQSGKSGRLKVHASCHEEIAVQNLLFCQL